MDKDGGAADADGACGRSARIAWCIFDWANSAFPTVVITFVFAAYFTKAVAENEVLGTSHWAYSMSLSALAVALVSPIFGAIADQVPAAKSRLGRRVLR